MSDQMRNTSEENRELHVQLDALQQENEVLQGHIKLLRSFPKGNNVLKKEIFWDIIDFNKDKLSFYSDPFSLLDCVFHLVFLKSGIYKHYNYPHF